MRVVPSNQVRLQPLRCAVVPTIGPVSGHRFVDTGQDLYASSVNVPQRIYVSEPAVREMARLLGWTPPEEVQAASGRVEALLAEVEQLRGELVTAERQIHAVQVLKQAGYVQAKPPGRPKKTPAAA